MPSAAPGAPWQESALKDIELPPTEEERRNAARMMRRLFRSRREPGGEDL